MTRTRARIAGFLALVLITALIGAAYGAFLDYILRSELSANSLLRGAARGLILGIILVLFEYGLAISRFGQLLRRAPFLISLLLHSVATTAVLTGATIISRILLSSGGHPLELWLRNGLVRDLTFFSFVAFLMHFILQAKRIVGGKTLLYFLFGRYNKPLIEQRIFMLIDIVGSTTIAQKLGEQKALALISQLFFDIAEPVRKFGGETILYVGDEVVVSWPFLDRAQNRRFIECYLAIRDVLGRNKDRYSDVFGQEVAIRVGVHGGPVAVGECGDEKRQVVFIGDTINVAKRLEEACREYHQEILVSASLLERTELPPGVTVRQLGKKTLRGRDSETGIDTLVPQDDANAARPILA
jgi:class 3 adenylate cyclase